MGIKKKILQVQSDLKAPKGQYNSFGKYNYRSAEDILEAVKPLLHDKGLVQTISDEIISVGDRIYVKSTVTLYDAESDESLSASALAREDETKKGMDSSQITGSTSSYARKYALNGMYAIDDTKDSDATNTGPKKSEATEAMEKATMEEIEALLELGIMKGQDEMAVRKAAAAYYRVDDLKKLSKVAIKDLSDRLKKLPNVFDGTPLG